jgi:ribose/xylose/arabinose/galactoside ABC-type transport system permease subunit
MTQPATNAAAAAGPSLPSNSAGRRATRALLSVLGPFLGLAIVVAIFVGYQLLGEVLWGTETSFLSGIRVTLIAQQSTIVAMGALGMTLIIISGGIDLSAGSLLAFHAVLLAWCLKGGVDPYLSVLAVVASGLALGTLNGVLITGLRLVPFIVTLGTMLIFRGAAEWISRQRKIQAPAPDWLSTLLDAPPDGSWRLVSTGAWLVVLFGILLTLVLKRTVFGRYVFAIGSNEATARLCGLPVNGIKIAVYALGGLFMALAGILSFNELNKQGSPTEGIGLELNIIAAVVIGGGSLSGGRGSVLGSIIGALTMTTLRHGCIYVGLSDPVQKLVIGAIIIAAVAIDQGLHRRRG